MVEFERDQGAQMNHSDQGSESSQADLESELDRVIYHISHDLRASIRALLLIPQWIEEDLQKEYGEVPASIRDHVHSLTNQSGRLDRMLLDLLKFSRAGRERADEIVDLALVLDQLLLEEPLPDGFEMERDFKVSQVVGAGKDVAMLLSVLLSNAITHGGRKLHISSRQEKTGVALTFHDNGTGIAKKYQDKIFEAMTTLRSRDQLEGSGMGLAIARKIMSRHGGTIQVVSDGADQGTTFVAVFPKR